ncbi:MAG: hypothetical protein LAT52_12590, partial [Balneolales bacterium]|nr:hypothetical protein [Balneolales bacterium]
FLEAAKVNMGNATLIAEQTLASIELIGDIWSSHESGNGDFIQTIEQSLDHLYELKNNLNTTDPEADPPDVILGKIFDYLAVEFLKRHHPSVYHASVFAGLITTDSSERQKIEFSRIAEIIQDPLQELGNIFDTNSSSFNPDYLIIRLYSALTNLTENVELIQLIDDEFTSNAIRLTLLQNNTPPQTAELGAFLSGYSEESDQSGLRLNFFGNAGLNFERTLSNTLKWALQSSISADLDAAIEFTDNRFRTVNLNDGAISTELSVASNLTYIAPPPGHSLFSLPGLANITFNGMDLGAKLEVENDDKSYDIRFQLKDVAFSLQPDNPDGFIATILPENGLQNTFDIVFGFNDQNGLYFQNGNDLSTTISLNTGSPSSLLNVSTIQLSGAFTNQELDIEALLTGNVKLGPLAMSVDGLGLKASIGRRTDPDTFNVLNFHGSSNDSYGLSLSFRPPSAIGLTIDTGAVTGGGFLSFNPDKGEYAGVLQLEFAKVGLNAIGILNTKMPDGSKGYSLLLIITAEFTPSIQLGFGFSLSKVGGLFGAHRNVLVEAMREGLRTNSLGSILFPQDPVNNAPALISSLGSIFPVQQSRYVFGPMASITWGTPKILTIELGVLLDMPSPLRLIILGRIRMALPTEQAALVKINLDMLGVIDFGEKTISIDATLFDSRLTLYTLSGDMAMRMKYGNKPAFALSLGGMHPAFNRPPAFPELDRLAISLSSGNNPKMRLEAYLALTSNTAQVGARLDLYAAAGNWNVTGTLGFDALFQFSPFYFIVDVYGSVALRRKSKHIMGLAVSFTLSGPNQWRAKGKATIKILLFKGSISFDLTIGKKKPEELPSADVWPLLKSALEADDNWYAELPSKDDAFVMFKEGSSEKVHPLGVIQFRQQVVPFNLEIEKFGNALPTGARTFRIEGITSNSNDASFRETKEYFAPAQFLSLTDKEKLSRPSFESFTAGAEIQSSTAVAPDGTLKTLEYEQIVVDGPQDVPLALKLTLHPKFQTVMNRNRAAIGKSLTKTGFARYNAPSMGIQLKEKAYAITDKQSMQPVDFTAGSYAETAQKLRQMDGQNTHQVVDQNELLP